MYSRVLDFLYPRTCPFCGKIYKYGVCPNCMSLLIYTKGPLCLRCGKPLQREEQEYCADCAECRHYFDEGRGLYIHSDLAAKAIYQFKYHNKRVFGEVFAAELFLHYRKLLAVWGIEVIIPVPLHPKRMRTRGYNQAQILAEILGREMGIPVCADAVFRIKYTTPQKKLSRQDRSKNLQGAFAISKSWEVKQRVLIIDDIYTTGSTIDAVAKLLKKRGSQKVFFLTISIGQGL